MGRRPKVQPTDVGVLAFNVRRYRESMGWSMTELGRRAGMAQSRISDFESGITDNPLLHTLERLASALGVTVGQLVDE